MTVKIICDSINPVTGKRLTTFLLVFPKCLLAELNTHRMLSRNAGSSRAKPAKIMRKLATFEPHIWLQNKRGMQGDMSLNGYKKAIARFAWWFHRQSSLFSNWLAGDIAGLHKQYANRLLETHAYIEVVVSATEWDNFFLLRNHEDTQPEFKQIAEQMQNLLNSEKPTILTAGDWHLPYILDNERSEYSLEDLISISVARCARVSYSAFNEINPSKPESDKKLCKKLFGSQPMHLSPTEHVAQCTDSLTRYGNFIGWKQYRKTIKGESGCLK